MFRVNRKIVVWGGIVILCAVCVAAVCGVRAKKSCRSELPKVFPAPDVCNPAETTDKPLPEYTQIDIPPQPVRNVNLEPAPVVEPNSPALPAEPNKEQIKKMVMAKIAAAISGGSKGAKVRRDRTKLFAVLHDETSPLKKRCNAAFILAREANDTTFYQFLDIFYDAQTPSELKAAILAGIGYSKNPAKIELIKDGLKDSNEDIVCGAIRGLQGFSEDYAVDMLSDFVNSKDTSERVKNEAISSLGGIQNPAATKVLTDAYYTFLGADNKKYSAEIIKAAGQKDFSQTQEFFTDVLKNSDTDASSRLAIAETLENSDGQASSILTSLLHDPDSKIRAAAAWSLATATETGDISAELLAVVKQETDSETKKRLYQALGNQENINAAEVIPSITAETDISTKIAGYDLVAIELYKKDQQIQDWFVTQALPELKDTALNAATLNTRLSAVIAIKKAGLSQTEQVLSEIAETSKDEKVVLATGLK